MGNTPLGICAFPSCLHPHRSHVPCAKYCLGGHGTCTGIAWGKQVHSSHLSVVWEVLPLCFCFIRIITLCETFEIQVVPGKPEVCSGMCKILIFGI